MRFVLACATYVRPGAPAAPPGQPTAAIAMRDGVNVFWGGGGGWGWTIRKDASTQVDVQMRRMSDVCVSEDYRRM